MAFPRLTASLAAPPIHTGAGSFMLGQVAWHYRPASYTKSSLLHTSPKQKQQHQDQSPSSSSFSSTSTSPSSGSKLSDNPSPSLKDPQTPSSTTSSLPPNWEDDPQLRHITHFSDLPHRFFGHNQHIKINDDFKEALRQILWTFRAPIRYAFAYGSGVFGQASSGGKSTGNPGVEEARTLSPHPNPPKAVEEWQKGGAKVIDFIFGVSHTQHWHSLNLTEHPSHYSGLQYLPYKSAAISFIQDRLGAGVYFNPYINVNGTMIKYGVVNLDTLASDLSDWRTLYLAGRLQKPVKILRDDPRIRLANQINLLSALRTALLMLPERFTERELYERIAGLSYLGDPRMLYIPGLGASENISKVHNIVGAQLPGFRQLYVPLIENLPNVTFADSRKPGGVDWEKEDAIRHTGSNVELDAEVLGGKDGLLLEQAMEPGMRGDMVRRLPRHFRKKIYYQYQRKFGIPGSAFDEIETGEGSPEASEFDERISQQGDLGDVVAKCVQATVQWPATSQTVKSFFTAGVGRAWRYYLDKRKRSKEVGKAKAKGEEAGKEGDGKVHVKEKGK